MCHHVQITKFEVPIIMSQLSPSGTIKLLLKSTCLFQTQGRESIAAKLVANLITEAGANRVLACDLHSGQSMGYFDIPVDHVYCQVTGSFV